MKWKLHPDILLAVATYYMHQLRSRADICPCCNKPINNPPCWQWNKSADLDAISAACAKHKIGFTSAAGTFWFDKGNWVIKCNSYNFMEATPFKADKYDQG